MSNRVKIKNKKKKNQEFDRKKLTPWLIALVVFCVAIVGFAVASSFFWGTQTLGSRSDGAATAAETSTAAESSTEAAAIEETSTAATEAETSAEITATESSTEAAADGEPAN